MDFGRVLFYPLYIDLAFPVTKKTFVLKIESTLSKTWVSVTGRIGSWTPDTFLNPAILNKNKNRLSAKLLSSKKLTSLWMTMQATQ